MFGKDIFNRKEFRCTSLSLVIRLLVKRLPAFRDYWSRAMLEREIKESLIEEENIQRVMDFPELFTPKAAMKAAYPLPEMPEGFDARMTANYLKKLTDPDI